MYKEDQVASGKLQRGGRGKAPWSLEGRLAQSKTALSPAAQRQGRSRCEWEWLQSRREARSPGGWGGNSFSSSGTSAGTSARTERKQEQARGRVWSPKTERSGSVSAVGGNGGCTRPVGRGGTPRPPAHPAPHTPARLERAGAELLEIWANPKCLCGLSGGERPGGKG